MLRHVGLCLADEPRFLRIRLEKRGRKRGLTEHGCHHRTRSGRARASAHAEASSPDPLRHHHHSADRADEHLRRGQQCRSGTCGHDHPDRDGGDALYRRELWPDGARLSQRGISLHLRGQGDSSTRRLCSGLVHADGLHAEPHHLCSVVQRGGTEYPAADSLCGLGRGLCSCIHRPQSAWGASVKPGERAAGSWHERCRGDLRCGCDPLHCHDGAACGRTVAAAVLRSCHLHARPLVSWRIDRGADLYRFRRHLDDVGGSGKSSP